MTAPESPEAVTPPPEPPTADPSEQLELKLPDESSSWRDLGLWAGVLVLLALVTFWPAVGGRFQWLDDRAVSEDRLLAMPGGLSAVWGRQMETPDHHRFAAYQPVAFTVNWVAYRFGGRDDNNVPTPMAYHVAALACHAGAAILVWLTLRELAVPAAWLVAAVFAVHPAAAQGVSWINDGGAPVGGLLLWGSAYAYLWHAKFRARDAADRAAGGTGSDPAQTWGVYAVAAVLAVAAELAWPAAGVGPAFLLLALWWRRRLMSLDTLLLVPLLAVNAVLWLTNLALPRPAVAGGVPALAGAGPGQLIGAVGSGLLFGFAKLFVPFPLKLIYTTGVAGGSVALLAAVVVLLVLPALVYARAGLRAPLAVGVAITVAILPALNWFDPLRYSHLTDVAGYLAVVPAAALVLAGAGVLVRRLRSGEALTQAVVVASAALLVVLGATAWTRAHVFDNPVSLWQDTADKAPRSAFAAAMLAEQYHQRAAEDAAVQDADQTKADLDAAIAAADRAVSLADEVGDPTARRAAERTWAAALVGKGDANGALPHFAAATAGDVGPADAATLVQYGQDLLTMGDNAAAITQLDRALAADPTSAATAHRVLGEAYRKSGNDARCLIEEQAAVAADPRDSAARQALAEALTRANRLPEALQNYQILMSMKENQARGDLWEAIGKIKDQQGAYDEAVQYLTTARQLDASIKDIDRDLAEEQRRLKVAATTRPALTRPATAPAGDVSPLSSAP